MAKTVVIKLKTAGPRIGPFTIKDNYGNVLAMYKKGDIVRRFDEGLKDGTIKFHDEQFNKPEETELEPEVLTTA